MQDPEPYLRALNIEVMCPVYPNKKARIDVTLRRRIGHDLFYFSTAQAARAFDRNPLKYAKALSDPVTSDRFKVTSRSPREEYKNRTYYFAADSTEARFDQDREKNRDRRSSLPTEGME